MFLRHNVRLYPDPNQEIFFRKTIGCCRFVYNQLLAWSNAEYERYLKWQKKNPDLDRRKFVWAKKPTELQLKTEFEFLKEPNAQTLQQSRIDLDVAYKRFFRGVSNRPKFHKKGIKESFRIPEASSAVYFKEGKLCLGTKCGDIKCRMSEPPKGRIKSATIKLDSGKWYASVLYEVEDDVYYQPADHIVEAVGIDVGVVKPLTVTTGDEFFVYGKKEAARLKELEIKRKRYQRQLARKQKDSINRAKARSKVARAFQKERFYRENWQHQVSNILTRNSKQIIFEDLKFDKMTKAGGKQKAGLNRELLRLGISGLISKCQYKADRRGGIVTFVNPAYTSQTCSECGNIDKKSRESQSRFRCVACGFTFNADKNAGLNILQRGLSS